MTPALANRRYLEETKKLKNGLEEGFLHLGERLYRIKEKKMWEEDYGSYAEFLMDLKVSEATASKLVAIYSKFVLEYKFSYEELAPCSWSSLYSLMPLATSRSKALALVEDAQQLKRGDVEEKMRSEKHPDCKHIDSFLLRICPDCGFRHRED